MSGPACNVARGEAVAVIAGEPRRLCLTLGALAELEAAFAISGWEALSLRLRTLSATDLVAVLAALLRGGGEDDACVTRATPREAAEAVAAAFAAASA